MNAYEYFTTQKEWERYLKDLLSHNDKAVLKAVEVIYDRQTDEEKYSGETKEENGIGFSKIDARELGDIAKKIKNGKPITRGEFAKARNKIKKYWKQLMLISKQCLEERHVREQERLDAENDKEERELQEQIKKEQEVFLENAEKIRRCIEDGVSCDYGICDECPACHGFQLRIQI